MHQAWLTHAFPNVVIFVYENHIVIPKCKIKYLVDAFRHDILFFSVSFGSVSPSPYVL